MNDADRGPHRNAPIELRRTDFRIATSLAGSAVLLAGLSMFVASACGSFHDDAIYVSTARSLAEGSGYHLIGIPGSPPQTKYPILYPLLLALVWKVWPSFPANLWLMQVLTLGCAAAAVALSYLYLVRFGYASRWVATGAAALAVTTPFLLFAATRTLSEMPFALLLVAALWRLEAAARNTEASRLSQFLTGVIIALPYLCRSIGVVLIPVALLVFAANRRPLRGTLLGLAVMTTPWVYWSATALGHWQADNIVGYYTDYLGSWSILIDNPGSVVGWNTIYLLVATLSTGLTGVMAGAAWSMDWGLSPVFLLAGAATWVLVLWRASRLEILPLFLAGYGALIVAWPWPPSRFLLPVLPFVLAFAGRVAAEAAKSLVPTLHHRILILMLATALLGNLTLIARFGALVRTTGFPYPDLPERSVSWQSYEETFAWIRTHTGPADRIASALDSMVHVYTNRQAFRPFRHRPDRLFYQVPGPKSGTGAEVFDALQTNGARYLAVLPIPGFAAELSTANVIAEMRRTYPSRLVPVYVGRDPRFVVMEVR